MKNRSTEDLQFPRAFYRILPSQYKEIFPEILDFLILAHRSADKILFLQTITKINEILANINHKVEQELQNILTIQSINSADEKRARVGLLITEITHYKQIVQSKLYLKMENNIAVQYPIAVTIKLMQIMCEKGQYLYSIIKSFKNDSVVAKDA